MKKILIISYFFPPANFVGGERTHYWAENLHKFGIYPILVTRKWNKGQKNLTEKQAKNTLEIEKNKNYEVHKLPYKYSLRDKFHTEKKFKLIRRMLTFIELLLNNFSIRSLPYKNFYSYTDELIKNNKNISILIASGRPFQSFFIGYKLKKKYPFLKWIPDYRDDWTTRPSNYPNGFLEQIIFKLDQRSEKKWTKNSNTFITVSSHLSTEIGNFINKNGIVIRNGYVAQKIKSDKKTKPIKTKLNLIYIGTLYEYQPIELLIKGIKSFCQQYKNSIEVTFVGTSQDSLAPKRLLDLTKNNQDVFNLVKRQSKENLQKLINHSDIAIMTNYSQLKGCLPVKTYDYYANELPIIVAPGDGDEIDNFIKITNSGWVLNTENEIICKLEELYKEKINTGFISIHQNKVGGMKYSRKYQTKLLADFLNTL